MLLVASLGHPSSALYSIVLSTGVRVGLGVRVVVEQPTVGARDPDMSYIAYCTAGYVNGDFQWGRERRRSYSTTTPMKLTVIDCVRLRCPCGDSAMEALEAAGRAGTGDVSAAIQSENDIIPLRVCARKGNEVGAENIYQVYVYLPNVHVYTTQHDRGRGRGQRAPYGQRQAVTDVPCVPVECPHAGQ